MAAVIQPRGLSKHYGDTVAVDAAARTALEAAGYAMPVVGGDGSFALYEPRALEAPDQVVRVLVDQVTPLKQLDAYLKEHPQKFICAKRTIAASLK